MAINLSPRQLSDARLTDDIDAILKETGMDSAHLKLEVTESAAMENPGRTFGILAALRQSGLQTADVEQGRRAVCAEFHFLTD
ncbi:MAG: hypothetical protein LT080_15820 [Thiobacillus sp.]|nr:hypothetical protein [Thiobacillus sp.]